MIIESTFAKKIIISNTYTRVCNTLIYMLWSRLKLKRVTVANEDRKALEFGDWFPAFCLHVMGKWGEVSGTIHAENDTAIHKNYGTVKSELETLSGTKVFVETVLPNGSTLVRLVKS